MQAFSAVGMQPDFKSFDRVDWSDLESIEAYTEAMRSLCVFDADMCTRALRIALEKHALVDAVLALGGEVAC